MPRIAPLLMAATLISCSAGNHGPVTGAAGQIKLSAKASPQLATSSGTAPLVCAAFSLQPYSLDASGAQTLAGAPVTLTSVAANQTDTIAGCIDQGTSGPNPNWGYLVTATHFVDCTTGQLIPGLSPSTVTGNYPVDCQAGIDVSLPIVVNVSIAQANNAGYVDISAGVNATDVQVGCKQADIQQDGEHFGESYIDPNGNILQGLVGISRPVPAGCSRGIDIRFAEGFRAPAGYRPACSRRARRWRSRPRADIDICSSISLGDRDLRHGEDVDGGLGERPDSLPVDGARREPRTSAGRWCNRRSGWR